MALVIHGASSGIADNTSLSDTSFSFALNNVTDEVTKVNLPQPESILNLVSLLELVAQVAVQSEPSIVATFHSISRQELVSHIGVHHDSSPDSVVQYIPQQELVAHADVQHSLSDLATHQEFVAHFDVHHDTSLIWLCMLLCKRHPPQTRRFKLPLR